MRGSQKFFRPFSQRVNVAGRESSIVAEGVASAAAEPLLANAAETAAAITPRDEAVFLLHTAAEVEHALMTQYLYAAFSVDTSLAGAPGWQRRILNVAREEMGHLMTVQNILHVLGGPVNFEREDYPFESRLYPFPLQLERLSLDSLGRYVLAEMPPEENLSQEEAQTVAAIRLQLGETNAKVNRVGDLYARLIRLIGSLPAANFDPSVSEFQALAEDWTVSGTPSTGPHAVLIPRVTSKEECLAALEQIAEQGEGATATGPDVLAHFDIFLGLYREIKASGIASPSLPVPKDPNTVTFAADNDAGSITHPQARRWAELANARYRLLLGFLAHFLQTPGPVFTNTGERTARGYLVNWAFFEMRNLSLIQKRIVQLPQTDDGTPARAAIPFELPYTLALPVRERDRWLFHRQVVEAALQQLAALRQDPAEDAALLDKLEEFTREQQQIGIVLETGALPEPVPAFRRVVQILEEAVRGFDVKKAFHDNVWRAQSEAELVAALVEKGFIEPGKPTESQLLSRLRAQSNAVRMPRGRPAVTEERIQVIERWIASLPSADAPPRVTGQTSFERVIQILNDAVQNQDFGAHRRFWNGLTRDQFVAAPVFGLPLITLNNGNGSNLIKALRGELPFGIDTGTAGASFRRMPAGRPPVPADQIAFIKTWIDGGCVEAATTVSPVNETAGGPLAGPVHNAYWREFDDWALFNPPAGVGAAVGTYFGAFPTWFAFAKGTATEQDWADAIAPAAVQSALQLLSAKQIETVTRHYGQPVEFLSVLDGYEKFGDASLPPDPLRPSDPKHTMNGPQMWFVWTSFADACIRSGIDAGFWAVHLRAVLLGAMNDGVFRGRYTVNGFSGDAAGKTAMRAFVAGLTAPGAAQTESRTRFRESGLPS